MSALMSDCKPLSVERMERVNADNNLAIATDKHARKFTLKR